MKRFYIFAILFWLATFGGFFSIYAQDLIILKDGNTIEASVLEISPTEIRYKRFDHLDGPTIVVLAVDVLSIKYENGRTEIINVTPRQETQTVNQPITPALIARNAQVENLPKRNLRFNTIGGTVGYLGISNFGFSIIGTISPANYTFFDFNLGLGFMDFSFNGNINFAGFVPFGNNIWYGGAGIGGGTYEVADSMNGFFAINVITGFLFLNWLNISVTLNMEVAPVFNLNIKPMVGYVYRFNARNNPVSSSNDNNNVTVFIPRPPFGNFAVEKVVGNVKRQSGNIWVDVKVGDILSNSSILSIDSNSSLYLIQSDGSKIETHLGGRGYLSIFLPK